METFKQLTLLTGNGKYVDFSTVPNDVSETQAIEGIAVDHSDEVESAKIGTGGEKKIITFDPPPFMERHLDYVFPEKLWYILTASSMPSSSSSKLVPKGVITWQPHGRAFRIKNTTLFEKDVMDKFFNQSKYSSFTRQLNLWDFQRIKKGVDIGCYYHPLFLRGKLNLVQRMRRRKVKGNDAKKVSIDGKRSRLLAKKHVDFYLLARERPLLDDEVNYEEVDEALKQMTITASFAFVDKRKLSESNDSDKIIHTEEKKMSQYSFPPIKRQTLIPNSKSWEAPREQQFYAKPSYQKTDLFSEQKRSAHPYYHQELKNYAKRSANERFSPNYPEEVVHMGNKSNASIQNGTTISQQKRQQRQKLSFYTEPYNHAVGDVSNFHKDRRNFEYNGEHAIQLNSRTDYVLREPKQKRRNSMQLLLEACLSEPLPQQPKAHSYPDFRRLSTFSIQSLDLQSLESIGDTPSKSTENSKLDENDSSKNENNSGTNFQQSPWDLVMNRKIL